MKELATRIEGGHSVSSLSKDLADVDWVLTQGRITFRNNKYTRWYKQLMARAYRRVLDGYSERHHIMPRCFGGTNNDINLVVLTFREHFLAHWLLIKMVPPGQKRFKMRASLWRMGHGKYSTDWQYEIARKNNLRPNRKPQLLRDPPAQPLPAKTSTDWLHQQKVSWRQGTIPPTLLRFGDEVRVTGGRFKGCNGVFKRWEGKRAVVVLKSVQGRSFITRIDSKTIRRRELTRQQLLGVA